MNLILPRKRTAIVGPGINYIAEIDRSERSYEITAHQYNALREKGINFGMVPAGVRTMFLYKVEESELDSVMVTIRYFTSLKTTDKEIRRGKACVLVI